MRRMATTPDSARLFAIVIIAALGIRAPAICADEVEEVPPVKDDVVRVPLYTVMPDYPRTARRDRIEGEVQVCFEISRDGQTRRVAVRDSTNRLFEKPAIRAVRASTYVPLSKDAAISGIKSCRTFRFALEPVVVETGS